MKKMVLFRKDRIPFGTVHHLDLKPSDEKRIPVLENKDFGSRIKLIKVERAS
jgi:hypothetical protein